MSGCELVEVRNVADAVGLVLSKRSDTMRRKLERGICKWSKEMVDLVGIEPTTSSMPWKRAPSCATGPFKSDCLSILTHVLWLVKPQQRCKALANQHPAASRRRNVNGSDWKQVAKPVKMSMLSRKDRK